AGTVVVEGEEIVEVVPGRAGREEVDLVHDGFVAPGLCDLQVNGAAGRSVTQEGPAVAELEHRLLEVGVTSYLPTLVTSPPDLRVEAVERLAGRVDDRRSPAVGIHLEGPLLNPRMRRVHDERWLEEAVERLPDGFEHEAVRLVTLAPEVPGGRGAIRLLAGRGQTVSLGHSAATAAQAFAAAEAGARAVTHLFNAMAPLHHRDPGLAGAALADERLAPMVIADGVHVDPVVLALVHRAAGERVVLVSDASSAAGAPEGTHRMQGIPIERRGDVVTDAQGSLAGSAVLLDRIVSRWREATRCTAADAWAAASERPAALVGAASGLAPGRPASLVLLDHDLAVRRVMLRGRWVAGG
ncbi:MAG: N-acetylglucosamine-6-phosphate deacetylase, partial [Solirubrobacteraceae bacterium]